MNNQRTGRFTATKLSLSVAVALVAVGSTSASAFKIDSGNNDTTLNWDTTIRYNAGWRMEDINSHFANYVGADETETRFKKNGLIMNRVDVFSELDYALRSDNNKYGFRVSAALWSENAYPNTSHTSDQINSYFGASAPPSNYGPSAQYSGYAKRYSTGSSGEFVDAFVFGGFELGSTLLSIKLGQHNVYWGETLYSIADGVSAGQGPLDSVKGVMSPGAEAKELFMPINQITANWSLSDEVSLMGQYQFDWKSFRYVAGGTFFSSSDAGMGVPLFRVGSGVNNSIRGLDPVTPERKSGNFGLALRWTPGWLEGTAGFYYRKYDEKLPWSAMQLQGGLAGAVAPNRNNNMGVRMSYARDTEMLGASLMRTFATISTGLDVSYRRNTALNTVPVFFAGSQGMSSIVDYLVSPAANIPLNQAPSYEQVEGARGNTFHVVLNGVLLLNKTALWETGNAQVEFAYQRLNKVTKNPDLYYSVDYLCKKGLDTRQIKAGVLDKSDTCATKDSLAFNLGFNPQWLGVFPSVDLTMPVSFSYGLRGNAPTIGGSVEGAYKWSIGLKAVYKTLYEFGVSLSDQHMDYKTIPATLAAGDGVPGQQIFTSGYPLTEVQNSHRWLSLRFKTTF